VTSQDRPDRAGDLGQILMPIVLAADAGDLRLRDHRKLGLGGRERGLESPAGIVVT